MTKRANGEGTIYQQKDGRWAAQLIVPDSATGKSKRRSYYGKTQKEANRKLQAAKNARDNGKILEPSKILLCDWLDRWLSDYMIHLKPTTEQSYRYLVSTHIVPSLGNVRLKDLHAADLQRFFNQKAKSGRIDGEEGLSSRTVKYIHVVLNKALQKACDLGLINNNPCKIVQLPKLTSQEITPLNAEQTRMFLEGIKEDWLYPLFFTVLRTGMRKGEVLGLKWEDIDFDSKSINIERSLVEVNGKALLQDSTKTKNSCRTIAISDELVKELRKHRATQKQNRLALGQPFSKHDFVFAWDDSRFISPSYLYHHFKKLLLKNGLPAVRFHDLRHTFATLAIKEGVNPKVLSEMLGHSSVKVTLDIYFHVSLDMQGEAAEKIEQVFTRK